MSTHDTRSNERTACGDGGACGPPGASTGAVVRSRQRSLRIFAVGFVGSRDNCSGVTTAMCWYGSLYWSVAGTARVCVFHHLFVLDRRLRSLRYLAQLLRRRLKSAASDYVRCSIWSRWCPTHVIAMQSGYGLIPKREPRRSRRVLVVIN